MQAECSRNIFRQPVLLESIYLGRWQQMSNEMKEMRTEFEDLKNGMRAGFNQLMKEIRTEFEQLENEMTTEVNQLKNEMKRMRNDMKPLTNRSLPTQENIWPIRDIFTQSYVHGLRELANESLSGIVKVVWCSILLLNLMPLIYQITGIARAYVEEVTITQISQIETNLTELNRPSICFTIFPDFLYQRADNGSFNDLEPLDNDSLLYLGYIKAMMPHFASSGLWLSYVSRENITWKQFQSLGSRPSLSMSEDTASLLSQNTLYDSLYYWGIGQIIADNSSDPLSLSPSQIHSKLSYVPKFYSDVLTRLKSFDNVLQYFMDKSWICVPIAFSTSSIVSSSGKGTQWFAYGHYYGEPAGRNILKEMSFSVMYFNTKHYPLDEYYGQSYLKSETVYKYDEVSYILLPTKFQHTNLSRQKCNDAKGEIYPRGYGETICFQDCLWENHARLFNCSFWEDFNEHPSVKVCHIFDIFDQVRSHISKLCLSDGDQDWCNNEMSKSLDEWNGLILQKYRDMVINMASLNGCEQRCAGWMFCDEWELEYGLRYMNNVEKQTRSALNWSGNEMHRDYTVQNFISVNKQVLKVSVEEFMANLGGTIGLYFGFSICGCLHLLLFLSINCCGKILSQRRRRHVQVAASQMSTRDTPDHSRGIRMVNIE